MRPGRLATAARALAEARRLAAHDAWSPARLEQHGRARLVELLRHARTHSPFYARRLEGIDLDRPVALDSLPTLDKATMLGHFDELVTDRRLRLADLEAHLAGAIDDPLHLGEYRVMATGGTTGQRGLFVYSRRDWAEVLGGMIRWSSGLMGLPPRLPRRRIAAVAADTPLHMTARMGRGVDIGLHRVLRLDARTATDTLVPQLNAFQPEALVGYASSVAQLAEAQLDGRLHIRPQTVCTTSEVRTEQMTARIRCAWEVEPYNCYASTETGIFAVDCSERQGLHVFTDQTLVEVVDEHGQPVPHGTSGRRIYVTSLVNRTQPLIRYELSDLVAITEEPCPCGRPFPRIVALDGRSDDMLALPAANGREVLIHPLTLRSPLAKVAGLRQYRVVHDTDGLTVEVVLVDPSAASSIAALVLEALAGQGVTGVPVRALPVDAIARHGETGKVKLIESRVPRRSGVRPA